MQDFGSRELSSRIHSVKYLRAYRVTVGVIMLVFAVLGSAILFVSSARTNNIVYNHVRIQLNDLPFLVSLFFLYMLVIFSIIWSIFLTFRRSAREFAEVVKYVEELRGYAVESIEPLKRSVGGGVDVEPPPRIIALANTERPLCTKERNTLLVIIGVLCHEAKLDTSRAAKTAAVIEGVAAGMGISISETTIESKLKAVPDALATRQR